jgi:predicted ATP-grasp superfamily ATP-dependent carboligase
VNGATVIVTDGNERSALAVVRSLGRAGYRCVVIAPESRSLAGASRYAAKCFAAPSPLHEPAAFSRTVEETARQEKAVLLIPVSEASLLALLPNRARFESCVIPFPDEQTFRAISDKGRVLSEAAALGIAVPAQIVIGAASDRASLDAESLQYPIVIKPGRSVGEAGGTREKLGVRYASTPSELRATLSALSDAAFPVLLQQRVLGPGTGIFLLVWNGEVRAGFAHRRITEKPPSGGVSVDRVSIPLEPRLFELSRALLARFEWQGVAMIEYKTDSATGIPYLMEINGRFWGSLQLAIDAGVDFPAMLAKLALGTEAPALPAYRAGVRSRWFWGQIDHLISRVPRRGRRRVLPAGTTSVAAAVADVVLSPFRRSTREEVFRWSDPRPFVFETGQWVRGR